MMTKMTILMTETAMLMEVLKEIDDNADDRDDEDNDGGEEREIEKLKDSTEWPKKKTVVEYKLNNGERGQAKILTQQPKKTGTHRDWV